MAREIIKWIAALAFIGGGACAQTIQGPLQAQNSLGELAANGTQATARVNISAAASGANSDITSLTGMTTPLGGAYGGTGINNGSKTITLGGSLATSGANPLTFTTTGTTSVTLPTSGTLFSSASSIPYTNLPALSANQVLGSLTATTPSGLSVPACTGANAALQWGAGAGFGCVTISSGTNAPGGANTNVQYNNSTAFGGNSSFTYNGSGSIGLGTSGSTTGNIAFANGTSGVVNLTVPTGALGTVTDYLPLGGTLLTFGTANNTYATLGANTNITSLGGLTTPLSPSQGGSGVNNGSATETRAGNVTFSGAYPVTLTATASTGVTLPTTGTLLNNVASSVNTVVGAASSTTRTDLSVPSCSGASNALQWTSGTGFGCGSITGTAATPGGSTGQVQYNNAGAFAAAPGFTFNGSGAIGLGVAGSTVGQAVFSNATSGSITLQAPTGALGSVTDTLPDGGTIATVASVQSQQNGGCLNILNYGGNGNGSTDNTSAMNSALAALPTNGGCIYFPAGKYDFASAITETYPASGIYSVTLAGAGADSSILYWPTATGGITINAKVATQSFHTRDLTFSTGTTNAGTALTLNNATLLGVFAQSDIYKTTFRGDDGGAATDYWTNAINVVGLSNINFDDDLFYGNAAGTGGTGIAVAGNASTSPNYGIVYNLSKDGFYNVGVGLSYGTYVQGVTVSQSNFTNGATCISVPSGGTGAAQLSLADDQFNCSTNNVIVSSPLASLMMKGNLLYINASEIGVNIASYVAQSTFTGNVYSGLSSSGSVGITATGASTSSQVSGNVFYNLATGLNLTGASGWNVWGNNYPNTTTQISNIGSNSAQGQLISAIASNVFISNNTPANITSITLTPGEWDVTGQIYFAPAGSTTSTAFEAAVNTTSATLPSHAGSMGYSTLFLPSVMTGNGEDMTVMPSDITVTSTTTIYLVAQATFGTSTMDTAGYIRARRVQ